MNGHLTISISYIELAMLIISALIYFFDVSFIASCFMPEYKHLQITYNEMKAIDPSVILFDHILGL